MPPTLFTSTFQDANAMSTSGLLEWEFSLPSDQIVSHGWYHGVVSRTAAENLLQQDREFLVRDSSSQPDNYVLSCRSNGQHLHFVIQRVSDFIRYLGVINVRTW